MESDIHVGIQTCPDSREADVQTITDVKEICVQVRPSRKSARIQVKQRTISTGKLLLITYKISKFNHC